MKCSKLIFLICGTAVFTLFASLLLGAPLSATPLMQAQCPAGQWTCTTTCEDGTSSETCTDDWGQCTDYCSDFCGPPFITGLPECEVYVPKKEPIIQPTVKG